MDHRHSFLMIIRAIVCLALMTAVAQAEELTLNISSVDTFRADANVARVCGALAVPEIPRGDSIYIDFAELIIPISANMDSTSSMIVTAAPIIARWTPGQQTPPLSLAIADEGYNPHVGGLYPVGAPTADTEIHINVTSMVTLWQQGKLPNFGVLVKSHTEGKSSFGFIKDGRYDGAHAKLRIVYCRP